MTLPTYLTSEQVADLLPFGNADWVRTRFRRGEIPAYKVGGRWLTTEEHVLAFVEAGATCPPRRRRRRRTPDRPTIG